MLVRNVAKENQKSYFTQLLEIIITTKEMKSEEP